METTEKNRVLKTKMGKLKAAKYPNSKFTIFENKKNGKKLTIEIISEQDIEANRNHAYQYLA